MKSRKAAAIKTELSAFFYNSPITMVMIDKDLRVTLANNHAQQFSNRAEQEMKGLRGGEALRCLHSLDDPRGCGFGTFCEQCTVRNIVLDSLKTGNSFYHIEALLPFTLNGEPEELAFLVSTVPMVFEDEQAVLVYLEDISTHRKVALSLKEERDKAQKYLDIAGVIVVVIAADQTVTLINKKGCEVLGYKEKDILGKNWFDHFIPKHLRKKVKSGFAQLVASEIDPIEFFENTVLTKKGEERIIAWHNTIVRDKAGKISATLSSGTDITAQKEAEEALIQSEARLAEAQRIAHLGNWEWDIINNRIIWSGELFRIYGIEPESFEATFDAFLKLVHPDDVDYVKKSVDQALTQKKSYDIEHRLIKPDGSVRWKNAKGEVVFNKQNQPERMVGISLDITEQKQYEEKIKASLHEKEVLLQEVHHRVKNNLQVIISLINFQAKEIKQEKITHKFKELQNRIRSIAVIHEMLYQADDLSRIDFSLYLKTIVKHLIRAYRKQKIEVQYQVKDLFLKLPTAIPVGLIINELVSNSLLHAFPDGKKGTITITCQRNNDSSIVFSIRDNGIGCAQDFLEKNTFGLKLVSMMVEQLNGHLEYSQRDGTSTRISFSELPVSQL